MRAARGVLVSLGLMSLAARALAATPSPAANSAPPVAAPAPVPAAPPPPPQVPAPAPRPVAVKKFAPLATPTLSHRLQFGLALLSGTGYRGIFPYQESIDCGQPDKRVCTGRLPVFLDVQPSFGFANHWDLLADLRFGIERDLTSRQFAVAPGFRYWVDPELQAKFFATIQVAYDTTAQHNPALRNNDFALRNSNGFMYEIMRNLGVYLQFGETIGFVRWLRFEIDAGLGIQARLP
jgi:hypothetical protein